MWCLFFFFFKAENGIRGYDVTGVQTWALPIFTATLAGPWTPTVKVNSMSAVREGPVMNVVVVGKDRKSVV